MAQKMAMGLEEQLRLETEFRGQPSAFTRGALAFEGQTYNYKLRALYVTETKIMYQLFVFTPRGAGELQLMHDSFEQKLQFLTR